MKEQITILLLTFGKCVRFASHIVASPRSKTRKHTNITLDSQLVCSNRISSVIPRHSRTCFWGSSVTNEKAAILSFLSHYLMNLKLRDHHCDIETSKFTLTMNVKPFFTSFLRRQILSDWIQQAVWASCFTVILWTHSGNVFVVCYFVFNVCQSDTTVSNSFEFDRLPYCYDRSSPFVPWSYRQVQ